MSRRLVVGLGALAVVIIGILIALLVRTSASPQPGPTPTTSESANLRQSAFAVTVRDDTGNITDGVVMGYDKPTSKATSLSLQPGLGVDIGNDGPVTLAELGPQSPQTVDTQLSDQLGVRIAGGLIMDRLAFAGLVDAVGGVVVDVPAPIIVEGSDGKDTVLAKAGRHRLYGPAAAAYVTVLLPGESQPARMARFDNVWKQVITTLPSNRDRLRTIVGSLGSSARMSIAPEVFGDFLADYQSALIAKTVTSANLPASGTGAGATELYTLTPVTAVPVITDLFGQALLVVGEDGALPRVRVVSTGATVASLVQVKQELTSAKFVYVWGGSGATVPTSNVYVPNPALTVPVGQPVAGALGLPNNAVIVNKANTLGVDASVAAAATILATPSSTPSSSR